MRRSYLVILIIAVLAIGLLLTRVGRLSPGGSRSQGQEAGGSAPATTVATSVSTSVAVAPPTAPPTALPRPTVAPTATPASRDVVMEVSEDELQSQLNTLLVGKSLGTTPLGDATVQTVSVALRDRQVRVSGSARAGFLNAPFEAAGTVVPDTSGRPKVNVNEASVGGVGLPDGTRAALADLLQTEVDRMFAEQSMNVRSIDIANGKMRVVGTTGS